MKINTLGHILGVVGFFAFYPIVQQPEPNCPPGKVRVGQHAVYRPRPPEGGGPAVVWVGGTCVSIADASDGVDFQLFPSYMVMAIMYAPPGNQSEVKYGSGSSLGSKTETKHSFKGGFLIHAETNFTETDIEMLNGATSGSAVELKKEQASTFSITSQADTASSDNDLFYIWLNPEVQVIQRGNTITTIYTAASSQPVLVVPVSVRELRDPSNMPPYKKIQLAKLTDADRQSILSLDPRAAGRSLDPTRFVKINSSLQLDGPDAPGATIPGEGLAVSNEMVNTQISGLTVELSVSFLFGGQVAWGAVAKFMVGGKLEYDYEKTDEASTGTKQEVEVELKTSTVGYHDVIDVYFDTLFNSFAFVSESGLMHQALTKVLTGVVIDASARPVPNRRVLIRLPDRSTRTLFTDSRGRYNAFNIGSGNVEVSVGGQKTTIVISPSKPKTLNIKLTKQ